MSVEKCCATGVDWFPCGGDDDVMTMVTPGMSMVKSEPAVEIDVAGPQPSTSGDGRTNIPAGSEVVSVSSRYKFTCKTSH